MAEDLNNIELPDEKGERPLLAEIQRRSQTDEAKDVAPAAPLAYLSSTDDSRRFPLLTRAQISLIAGGAVLVLLLAAGVFLVWRKQNREIVTLVAGGGAQTTAPPVASPTIDASPTPATPDDAAVLAAVNAAVANYNPTGFGKYTLEAKEGIVTINGEAETQPEKDGVENVIRPLPGVRGIVNNLIVRLTPVMIPTRLNEAEAKRLEEAMRKQYEGTIRAKDAKDKEDEAERERKQIEADREIERRRREATAARIRDEEERQRRETDERMQREAAERERKLEEQRQNDAARRSRAEQATLQANVLRSGTIAWSGIIDGAIEIIITGGSASVRNLNGEAPREVKSSFSAPVPRAPIAVRLLSSSGRGSVGISQEPSATNGYTTIIRLDDSAKGGTQRYEFTLRWASQ
jgi:hypothetical protein